MSSQHKKLFRLGPLIVSILAVTVITIFLPYFAISWILAIDFLGEAAASNFNTF